MMEFLNWLGELLGSDRYSQHAICLTNDPLMILMYASGNIATGVSYFIIGVTLLLQRRRSITLKPSARGLYGTFIFLCGLNHFTETLTMFFGVYRLDVMVVGAMAGVSLVTAIVTTREIVDV